MAQRQPLTAADRTRRGAPLPAGALRQPQGEPPQGAQQPVSNGAPLLLLHRWPARTTALLVCTALAVFRVWNGLVVVTYFNPDEYWQSVEVAHRWVFGYGHLTWEWRTDARLRGAAHPALFAGLYAALRAVGLPAGFVDADL